MPTGIIAYADHEINMQMSLKKIKKSKLSPWFMPYFSKMAQLIGLLSLVGIHPWLLLVLQWNIVECTRRHLKNECRDVSLLEIYFMKICSHISKNLSTENFYLSGCNRAKGEAWGLNTWKFFQRYFLHSAVKRLA